MMNGPLAQIVALTCYGNAIIGGRDIPGFFPANSTCQFCDSITFVSIKKSLFRTTKEIVIAHDPDEWLTGLRHHKALRIQLIRTPHNDPRFSDRMSAGFVGGGGTWMMDVQDATRRSEYWSARWDVWNQQAPQNRIWKVTYGLLAQAHTKTAESRNLVAVKSEFQSSLEAIHAFSARHDCGGFTTCFANALQALDDPDADVGYHKDLALPGQLTPPAASLLKAAMCAWVFGGMGSWNDMGFEGAAQQEYESVSDRLFNLLNEAIEVAANSSATPT